MSRAQRFIKRCIDLCLSAVLLYGLWPLMVGIALLIRCDSPGPALFRQQRAGEGGRPFTLLKFRTMRTDADPYGPSPRSGEDPRLTRIGRWLRERSLDELPQLINVLGGRMSLVGPRPLYPSQVAEWTDRQRRRLEVKPGLTGLAQISGRGGLTVEEKLELDVQYVERRCLKLDLQILARTFGSFTCGEGIYERRYSRAHEVRPGPPRPGGMQPA
jgi:lipopolysaccharide/colanic/teichoic acid biosynthesis glycosyltransferase